ncbi:MAG: PD-(D/E)XK nuclease family protein [Myxococcales bacterium]|nr:PD-(D/E)XK nuclease family protein [Myxococcales bacterium]
MDSEPHFSPSECRRAIASVLAGLERHRPERRDIDRIRASIHQLARAVAEDDDRRRALAAARLVEPVDPLSLPWDAFAWLGAASHEIRWTQWLAELLDSRSHAGLGPLCVRALAQAVLTRPEPEPLPGVEPMTRDDWRSLPSRAARLHVWAERSVHSDQGRARPDIVLETSRELVIIEIKLWGDWNDGQPEQYEGIARRLGDGRKVGLVHLTNATSSRRTPHWHGLRWRALGQALRRGLRDSMAAGVPPSRAIELMPGLVLVQAIEHHLVGLPRLPDVTAQSLDALDFLSRGTLTRYLTEISDDDA